METVRAMNLTLLHSTGPSTSWQILTVAVGISLAFYTIGLSGYRLFFHPLRHIPGPKLAALTRWTETYYECFHGSGGTFIWALQAWHAQYGPIIRIGPNEVHIADPSFYDVLYSQSRRADDKDALLTVKRNLRTSAFATLGAELHRARRAALNPFFSRRAVMLDAAPGIQRHMDRLCERIREEMGAVLDLNRVWGAFAADNIGEYAFGKKYNFILEEGYRALVVDALVVLMHSVHMRTHFPFLDHMMLLLPGGLLKRLSSQLAAVVDFQDEIKAQVRRTMAAHNDRAPEESAREEGKAAQVVPQARESLFSTLLKSDLPPHELSATRLEHEALTLVGAGTETTMSVLTVACFHVLANADILQTLRAGLQTAIPDPTTMPNVDALTQLPYLTCVLSEALRMSCAVIQRLPRISPTPLVYVPAPHLNDKCPKPIQLPAGTVVSMDHYTVSYDPWVFPKPHEFRPERWADDAKAPDGKPLTRYLVAFGKGARSCLGMQLAWAELYIGLASFFRRVECELFETGRDAVDVYMDRFVPKPKPGTKGVRVRVVATLG